MSAGQDAHVIELCAEVGDGMKGVRRRIVGLFEASTDLSVAEEATCCFLYRLSWRSQTAQKRRQVFVRVTIGLPRPRMPRL